MVNFFWGGKQREINPVISILFSLTVQCRVSVLIPVSNYPSVQNNVVLPKIVCSLFNVFLMQWYFVIGSRWWDLLHLGAYSQTLLGEMAGAQYNEILHNCNCCAVEGVTMSLKLALQFDRVIVHLYLSCSCGRLLCIILRFKKFYPTFTP